MRNQGDAKQDEERSMQETEIVILELTRSRLFILVSPPKDLVGIWGSQELAPRDSPLTPQLILRGKGSRFSGR